MLKLEVFMKTKESIDPKNLNLEKLPKTKQKSLRPMRSMIAVRSLKPKTGVASFVTKPENSQTN